MTGCTTCGGFDYKHDPVAHGPDYSPDIDGPPHPFEPSGQYDAGREVCAECGMDRAADEHRPPYGEDEA